MRTFRAWSKCVREDDAGGCDHEEGVEVFLGVVGKDLPVASCAFAEEDEFVASFADGEEECEEEGGHEEVGGEGDGGSEKYEDLDAGEGPDDEADGDDEDVEDDHVLEAEGVGGDEREVERCLEGEIGWEGGDA